MKQLISNYFFDFIIKIYNILKPNGKYLILQLNSDNGGLNDNADDTVREPVFFEIVSNSVFISGSCTSTDGTWNTCSYGLVDNVTYKAKFTVTLEDFTEEIIYQEFTT